MRVTRAKFKIKGVSTELATVGGRKFGVIRIAQFAQNTAEEFGKARGACVMCRVSCFMCRVSRVVCRVSCVVCRVSRVTCRVSCVMCRVACVAWRGSWVVCRGLARMTRRTGGRDVILAPVTRRFISSSSPPHT